MSQPCDLVMHPSTNDRIFVCCPFISFGVIIATKPEACPDHHYMCTQIVTVHHIRIHSELSEEVHSILWRFNHISRLCLGATNFQSRHMLLSSTYSHSSFLLIKMLMSPRSPFQKCWIPFSQFRNTLLLIPTEYDLLTFNQTKYRHLFPMKTRAEQFETEAFFGFRSTMK